MAHRFFSIQKRKKTLQSGIFDNFSNCWRGSVYAKEVSADIIPYNSYWHIMHKFIKLSKTVARPHDCQISTDDVAIFALVELGAVGKIDYKQFIDLRFSDTLLYPEPEVALFCGEDQSFGSFQNRRGDELLAGGLHPGVFPVIERQKHLDSGCAHPQRKHQKRHSKPKRRGQSPEQAKGRGSAQRQAEAQENLMLKDCGKGTECFPERGEFHSNTTRFFLSRPKTASTTASRVFAWSIRSSSVSAPSPSSG